MRMVRMSLCTGLLVVCGLMVSAAERVQEPQRSYTKASLRDASVDAAPVEDALAIDDALAAIAAAASACEPIGAFNSQFAGANRFRGDVFSITKQVDLIGIEMELAFLTTTGNPLELFFYVLETRRAIRRTNRRFSTSSSSRPRSTRPATACPRFTRAV